MKHRLKEPFGKAGLTVAILALALGLIGGAYAAGGLTKSQEKQVTKIAKKYAGKPGAPGANGTNGTNGAPGKEGPEGKAGSPGAAGADGKGVVLTAEPTGTANCEGRGGTKAEVEGNAASKKFVCNGEEGSPWTAGGTLPSGATETGTFVVGSPTDASEETPQMMWVSIAFPIPLEAPLSSEEEAAFHIVTPEVVENEEVPAECEVEGVEGSAREPLAAPGNLCLYLSPAFHEGAFSPPYPVSPGAQNSGEVGTTGTTFRASFTENGATMAGTWAVTAP